MEIMRKVLAAAAALIIAMMPFGTWNVYAADASAPGGVVASNSAAAAGSALGNAASVSSAGDTMIISLNSDVTLGKALTFIRGSSGDRVVFRLNGHSLKGAAGVSGKNIKAAAGGNAIEIVAADFDVVVEGPGTVRGGKGAVYETGSKYRYGMDGGCAVQFIGDGGDAWNPSGGRLEHGLTVSGGAVLTGGAGADVSSDDLLYNISKHGSGDSAALEAGQGGAGIGQENAGIPSGATAFSYAGIVIKNGTVTGGKGGNVNIKKLTPTKYAVMRSNAAADAMKGSSKNYYSSNVLSMLGFVPGRGGDGITVGAGRKYILVEKNGTVSGSSCGIVNYGSNRYINRLTHGTADAGNGISVHAGDIGLTNNSVGWTGSGWQSKDRNSDDMGIYIEGKVTGGDSADVKALNDSTGNGGAGIFLNGDAGRYAPEAPSPEPTTELGIVSIAEGGAVSGGKGGNAVCGNCGNGGDGIREDFEHDNDGIHYDYGTDYYIVNGKVTGGNGGTAFSNEEGYGARKTVSVAYIPALQGKGSFGTGGNGIDFLHNYRSNVNVAGTGSVTAGNAGKAVVHGTASAKTAGSPAKAIRFYQQYDSNKVTVDATDGKKASASRKGSVKVKASMTGFKKNPTSSTRLSYKITKPSGYKGKVYVVWTARIYESSSAGYIDCDIESSGKNYRSFRLLSNKAYKYLEYPMYSGVSWLNMNNYNLDVATVNRMREDDKTKVSIYCTVMLEDGRWGKSNVMTFKKGKGWK